MKKFLILILFLGFTSIKAMEEKPENLSQDPARLEKVISKLRQKFQDFKDYADDARDYYQSLKVAFNPKLKENIENFHERLKLLNDYEKRLCQLQILKARRDKELCQPGQEILVSRILSLNMMYQHFDDKSQSIDSFLHDSELFLIALEKESLEQVFRDF